MKILVTGANGFIGKNLVAELTNRGYRDIYTYTRDCDPSLLEQYLQDCQFVFHLAGVNRPKDEHEFESGNAGLTSRIVELLQRYDNRAPVLITSSIQAERDNPYGRSKKIAETILFEHNRATDAKVYIYRLPNVFGKWSRPNYNSVVATFAYNIARNLDIQIHDPNAGLTLCYIDDVVDEFIRALEGVLRQKEITASHQLLIELVSADWLRFWRASEHHVKIWLYQIWPMNLPRSCIALI